VEGWRLPRRDLGATDKNVVRKSGQRTEAADRGAVSNAWVQGAWAGTQEKDGLSYSDIRKS